MLLAIGISSPPIQLEAKPALADRQLFHNQESFPGARSTVSLGGTSRRDGDSHSSWGETRAPQGGVGRSHLADRRRLGERVRASARIPCACSSRHL